MRKEVEVNEEKRERERERERWSGREECGEKGRVIKPVLALHGKLNYLLFF